MDHPHGTNPFSEVFATFDGQDFGIEIAEVIESLRFFLLQFFIILGGSSTVERDFSIVSDLCVSAANPCFCSSVNTHSHSFKRVLSFHLEER